MDSSGRTQYLQYLQVSCFQGEFLKPCSSFETTISHQNSQCGTCLKKTGEPPFPILGGVRQTGDRGSVTSRIKNTDRTVSRVDLRDVLERMALLLVLLFVFWATSWIFLVRFGGYYFNQASSHPGGISLWLFNTAIPIFHGLGTLGAVVGVVKRDKPVSFLVGFLPNILNFVIYASLPAFGPTQIYSDFTETALGFFTLLWAGIGLGLVGSAGSFYGDWREHRRPGDARISLLLFIMGFSILVFIVWSLPGYGAAVP